MPSYLASLYIMPTIIYLYLLYVLWYILKELFSSSILNVKPLLKRSSVWDTAMAWNAFTNCSVSCWKKNGKIDYVKQLSYRTRKYFASVYLKNKVILLQPYIKKYNREKRQHTLHIIASK